MPGNRYRSSITCCYLYIITQHGYPPPAANTIQYLMQMKEKGFASVELEGIREEHLMEVYGQRFEIKKTMDELELKVPYFCAVLPGLGSTDKAERKANLDLFRKGCEIASLLGSHGILDNAPLPPYQFAADIPVVRHYEEEVILSAGLPRELNWKKYWNELIGTYREACDIAGEYGLTYQMHPAAGVLSATTDAFLYFAQAVDRSNLRFNLDTANQFFLKDNLVLSLIRLADYIDYIHLSDNRGQHVEHLVPGDGSINWTQFFQTLSDIGFKGHYGIDVGGDESHVADIHEAYQQTAQWLEKNLADNKL
ncbi:MAG: sugar phosphate isomerase/epimerase family protein [Bacteroidota bacterium]